MLGGRPVALCFRQQAQSRSAAARGFLLNASNAFFTCVLLHSSTRIGINTILDFLTKSFLPCRPQLFVLDWSLICYQSNADRLDARSNTPPKIRTAPTLPVTVEPLAEIGAPARTHHGSPKDKLQTTIWRRVRTPCYHLVKLAALLLFAARAIVRNKRPASCSPSWFPTYLALLI